MRLLKSTIPAMMLADLCALFLAFILAYLTRSSLDAFAVNRSYLGLAPLILCFIPLYAAFGLYPGLLLAGPEHLKRLSIASSVGMLFFGTVLFVGQVGYAYSRFVVLFFWLLALFAVPLARFYSKKIYSRFAWWGYPVILIGKSRLTALIAGQLRGAPELGHRTVAVFNLDEETLPVSGINTELLPDDPETAKERLGAAGCGAPQITAVLVMEGLSPEQQQKIYPLAEARFRRLIIIPDASMNIRLSVNLSMFCSRLSLSLRQNLLDPCRLQLKYAMDLGLAVLMAAPLLPFFLLISLAIALDSRGPVFYRQERLGQGGRKIRIWKFRTMYKNADQILDVCLTGNPTLHEEWRQNHKLRSDPRITRVGKYLRKASLDELPQLFNIFQGDMSLVGPRPIVEEEVKKYGAAFELYKKVKPGISGLWQVSGRNNTSYAARVALDEAYIANWSVWLDIYILVRTLPAALTAEGAY
ncbi:MAG: undecaprenyl-phosphate galactose phosphotransferase WbaP [Desulfovibrionaceae bacterium]|nr:undecaprenyl-phosphate galactose phosphotransferase WbaP [Desulfovibrionaceae bacterium]